jgi:tRNA (guanine37-N1)-methyltransferase
MIFDIITLFPEIFETYLKQSLIGKAQKNKIVKINTFNLRNFTSDKHKTVDDKAFGGGRGMVLKVGPIYKVVQSLKKKKRGKTKVILFTPRGKKFNQKMATRFSKLDELILISGRYEGVDERIAKHIVDEEVSIGDYVLMGGDLPALVLIEAVSRLIPKVIGKPELLKERITKNKGFIEYPQYTRPEVFSSKKGISWKVPKILLSGDHKKIEDWRKKNSKIIE